MTTFLIICFGYWTMALCVILAVQMRKWDRIYKYAETMAKKRFEIDILDPAGRAYSDMATVIALDGKAEEKVW